MTARIVVSCDGHRHGQPCRGALMTHSEWRAAADDEAARAGWRDNVQREGRWLDLCPSGGHDEDGHT